MHSKDRLVRQALKCSAQLGIIGKFSRVVLTSDNLTDILNQAADLLNDLEVSGILLVYRENHVAKASFGKGLDIHHVNEIDTQILSGDRVYILSRTLVFNLPRMNLLIDINDMHLDDLELFQDNLSVWFDTLYSVIDAFCEKQELVEEKKKIHVELASEILSITDSMKVRDEQAASNASDLFAEYMCKVESMMHSMALDEDQEQKIADLMFGFVANFKNHLDENLMQSNQLQKVLETVRHELTEKGGTNTESKRITRISLDRRKMDIGSEPTELF